MPRPKALSPAEAERTLVHRFGKRVNRLRQIAVRFGLRPYRVWMVWYQWTGDAVGEGTQEEVKREEILPTPDVVDSTKFLFLTGGKVDDGMMVMRKVDPTLGEMLLNGQLYAGDVPGSPCPDETTGGPTQFYFLVKEDGRSPGVVMERWFTLVGTPFRKAGQLDWDLTIQQVSRNL